MTQPGNEVSELMTRKYSIIRIEESDERKGSGTLILKVEIYDGQEGHEMGTLSTQPLKVGIATRGLRILALVETEAQSGRR